MEIITVATCYLGSSLRKKEAETPDIIHINRIDIIINNDF